MQPKFPISTGEVVVLLGVPEHRITSQIRLGKVIPPMTVGRRAWSPANVLQVAKILGKDSIEVRSLCHAAIVAESKASTR